MNLLLAVHPDGRHSTPVLEEAIQDDLPPINEVFSAEARDAFNYLRRVTDMYNCFEMPELVLAEIDVSFRQNGEYNEIIWMATALYTFGSGEINRMLGFYEEIYGEDVGVCDEDSDQSMEMDDIDDEELDEMLEPVTPETHY